MPPDSVPCSADDPCLRNIPPSKRQLRGGQHVVDADAVDHGRVDRDLAGVRGFYIRGLAHRQVLAMFQMGDLHRSKRVSS
ncbi:hypothetical protein CDAR_489921 [Caerostris darwini]|uniref:Uncharacterized protein n=1 Tax=Caerostris darwini TaxID=1538125 RepID=A0AAV4VLS8_9ARAC|nr:hypothetical protein CDAR_489921 [Caerostris darwini]